MSRNARFVSELTTSIDQLKADQVYKRFNYIESPQGAKVKMEGKGDILVLSSNNYLGLSAQPEVIWAGMEGLKKFGAGTGSVRFICGTFTVHRELEAALARFVGTEASLSYVACWNANEALTQSIAQEGDFVVSDALNHASIIDSIRLAKAITKCTTGGLQALRHGRPGGATQGQQGGAPAGDLDRRGVLDGGEHREAARDPPDRAGP